MRNGQESISPVEAFGGGVVWFARLVFEFAPRIHHCPRLICQSVNLARRGLHRIADRLDLLGIFVRNLDVEVLFESQDELDHGHAHPEGGHDHHHGRHAQQSHHRLHHGEAHRGCHGQRNHHQNHHR